MKLFIAQLVCWSALCGKSNCCGDYDYSDSKTQPGHYQNWTSIIFDLFPTEADNWYLYLQTMELIITLLLIWPWQFLTLLEVLNIQVLDDETGQIFGQKRAEKGFVTAKGRRISIKRCKLWRLRLGWKNGKLKLVNKKVLTLLQIVSFMICAWFQLCVLTIHATFAKI